MKYIRINPQGNYIGEYFCLTNDECKLFIEHGYGNKMTNIVDILFWVRRNNW